MPKADPSDASATRATTHRGTRWEVEAAEWKAKLNMPTSCHPYSDLVGKKTMKTGTKRVWDLLDCTAVHMCRAKRMRLEVALFAFH